MRRSRAVGGDRHPDPEHGPHQLRGEDVIGRAVGADATSIEHGDPVRHTRQRQVVEHRHGGETGAAQATHGAQDPDLMGEVEVERRLVASSERLRTGVSIQPCAAPK
jgi:hypothetical protein